MGMVTLSESLGTPSLPKTHRLLGYRWLNSGSRFRKVRRDNYSHGFAPCQMGNIGATPRFPTRLVIAELQTEV